jgi:hypothetical protein
MNAQLNYMISAGTAPRCDTQTRGLTVRLFCGAMGGRALGPGSYRLLATPTTNGRLS